jgi:hypothetical protein
MVRAQQEPLLHTRVAANRMGNLGGCRVQFLNPCSNSAFHRSLIPSQDRLNCRTRFWTIGHSCQSLLIQS